MRADANTLFTYLLFKSGSASGRHLFQPLQRLVREHGLTARHRDVRRRRGQLLVPETQQTSYHD